MVMLSKGFVNFNKEVLFGQGGALLGTQIAALISSGLTTSSEIISIWVVIGSLIGAAAFWAPVRIYDETRRKKYSTKKFIKDIEYFTPAAFIVSIIFYLPSLYYFSKFFIETSINANLSAIISQAIAFLIFVLAINIYRILLYKLDKKKL